MGKKVHLTWAVLCEASELGCTNKFGLELLFSKLFALCACLSLPTLLCQHLILPPAHTMPYKLPVYSMSVGYRLLFLLRVINKESAHTQNSLLSQ